MSAASTSSAIRGQSSEGQPCSVMSGCTPGAMSWSTARRDVTLTSCDRMSAIDRSISVWVCESCGEGVSVQLM
jgi:hypothetical protein